MRTIVCFGDSNTHGADPGGGPRFGPGVRWPGVMRRELGDGWTVIEEGLNGRTTIFEDPFEEGRNGRRYLLPCLRSHAPVDLVTIMLGMNDLKRHFHVDPPTIARAVSTLVGIASRSEVGPEGRPPQVLLMVPVPLGAMTPGLELGGFEGAPEASRQLSELYALVARERRCAFLDAGGVASVSALDGLHLDREAHAALGAAVARQVRAMFPDAQVGD